MFLLVCETYSGKTISRQMSVNRTETRADTAKVTAILSRAYSRTQPCPEDTPYEPINHAKVDKLGYPTAWIQEVVWETYKGVHGPDTLLKQVEHDTMKCPECGCDGWYDHRGDVICEDETCGRVISDKPLMLPEDHFNDRTSGMGGKPALNPAAPSQAAEPDVQ